MTPIQIALAIIAVPTLIALVSVGMMIRALWDELTLKSGDELWEDLRKQREAAAKS